MYVSAFVESSVWSSLAPDRASMLFAGSDSEVC